MFKYLIYHWDHHTILSHMYMACQGGPVTLQHQHDVRERSLLIGARGIKGGGHKFECKHFEGGGQNFSADTLRGGGKISVQEPQKRLP